MDYKDNDFAKAYLSKMDDVKFLTKEEQIELGFEIKKNEKLILENCIKFNEFRKQILTLKVAIDRNPDNIVKFSKDLDDSSKSTHKLQIAKSFDSLFESLETGSNDDCIKYLSEINLSSSTINQLLMPIKERYRTLQSHDDNLKRVFRFLEVNTIDEVFQLEKDLDDKTKNQLHCKRLFTTESKLNSYISDARDAIKFLEDENMDRDGAEELKVLYKKINQLESKVEEQRNKLIESCLPLVINRAKRFTDQGLDFEDLVQEGNIGLMKAVDKFEPNKNIKVTTYASWWIDQAIRRAISNKAKTVRIPIHIQDVVQKINKAYHQLCHILGREPNHKEIAKHTGIKLKVISEIHATAQYEVGLDEEVSSGVSYEDILPDGSSSALSKTSKSMLYNTVRAALSELSPRDEKILRLRFGIGEVSDHTLEEIGNHYGITRERVRQVEKRALRKFGENIEQEGVDE